MLYILALACVVRPVQSSAADLPEYSARNIRGNESTVTRHRRGVFIHSKSVSDMVDDIFMELPTNDGNLEPLRCGADILLDAHQPVVKFCSQGYPFSYPSLTSCYFFVHTNSLAHLITVNITDIDIKKQTELGCADSVEVRYYNMGEPGPAFCGSSNKGLLFRSFKNMMMLKLNAGPCGQGAGFCAVVSMETSPGNIF